MVPESPLVDKFRAARHDPERVVLEGFHAVKHAMRFGAELMGVVATDPDEVESLAVALAPDLRESLGRLVQIVDGRTFSALAPRSPRTGVIGLARRPTIDVSLALSDRTRGPVVLLEDPRNLGNLGACIRVAAAADAPAVLTTGEHDPWQADAVRGAAGLHFALPIARVSALPSTDRPLIAVDPDGDPFDPADLAPDAILAFGTERYGLTDELLARADGAVAIPMRSGVSSLNLATSVAAVLIAWRLIAAPEAASA